MGKACTCCEQPLCTCNRKIKSLDFSFGNFKTTFEIDKPVTDVSCFMYFYVGDATGYYKQDGTRVPYKKHLIEIIPNPDEALFTSYFKIDLKREKGGDWYNYVLKLRSVMKFYENNGKYYFDIPDERLVFDIPLRYKKKKFDLNRERDQFYRATDKYNILDFQKQLRDSGIEEFKNCIVNCYTSNLPVNPSLNISWQDDLRCPFRYGGFKWYRKNICNNYNECGIPGLTSRSSYLEQNEISSAPDYTDSLGVFSRTYHGFLITVTYEYQYSNVKYKNFKINTFPNYLDKFVENNSRTRVNNLLVTRNAKHKWCKFPFALDSLVDFCASGNPFRSYGPICPPFGGSNEEIGWGPLAEGEIDIDSGPSALCLPSLTFCNGNLTHPLSPTVSSCSVRKNYEQKIFHTYRLDDAIKTICESLDNCCCSQDSIFIEKLHCLAITQDAGVSTYYIDCKPSDPFNIGYSCFDRPTSSLCKSGTNIVEKTVLNLYSDNNCYSSKPSELLRSIFRLTDIQTTPPIEGCFYVRGQHRVKIFENPSSQKRFTYFLTPEQFNNGIYDHETEPRTCLYDFDSDPSEPVSYYKIDPEINAKIPFYIDEFDNLKFKIFPQNLLYIDQENIDVGGGNYIQSCFNTRCSYEAIIIRNYISDPLRTTLTLHTFEFVLTPVYIPGPPIDSYFIMRCTTYDKGIKLNSDPIIIRNPQDLYQDIRFNIPNSNIIFTVNLLGTWRG